jgi:hypothetical protein
MKSSSYLKWLIMAALPVGSYQRDAAGSSLQEKPGLPASETDLAFSLFDDEEGYDEEDEMVGSTHILKSFCSLSFELYLI